MHWNITKEQYPQRKLAKNIYCCLTCIKPPLKYINHTLDNVYRTDPDERAKAPAVQMQPMPVSKHT
jgi:hypothetical protein